MIIFRDKTIHYLNYMNKNRGHLINKNQFTIIKCLNMVIEISNALKKKLVMLDSCFVGSSLGRCDRSPRVQPRILVLGLLL